MAGIVSTIGQRCKRCYSCIRECPATAIRVENGQAVVIQERCISCGHCVKVCSQKAKEVLSEKEKVLYELIPSGKTVAAIAPSFAASFPDNYNKIPTALREIGFDKVCETAFGADLISKLYKEEFEKLDGRTIISSPCPAINNLIEKYYTNLVPNLAKIVSPMIAIGRYIKSTIGKDVNVVFIGPCVAKKSEYRDEEVEGAVDAVLTFSELKEIFQILNINPDELEESGFDPPYAYLGKSFPLTGGLLKTADISSDVLARKVIVADGKDKVKQLIKDIANNKIDSKFVDILFCEGCINGPAVDSDLNFYSRREKVIEFIDEHINDVDKRVWQGEIYNSRTIDLTRNFSAKSQRRPMPSEEKIKEILAKTEKYEIQDELNCGACGYPTCREYAIAIAKGLAEEDMCLPYLIEKLEKAYTELKETQDQLHNAEKLASIGQLAAGVAHEINNPLGTIILYSSMLLREYEKNKDKPRKAEDIKMIIEEANRCKNIVANLLNFARHGKLKIAKIDISKTLNDIIKSLKLNPKLGEVIFTFNNSCQNSVIDADADQMKQVFLNIITNGLEAMEDSETKDLTVNVKNDDKYIVVEVIDTGCGISSDNIKKLFTPFFTTKKMGRGTGLGLAISYGIIKMHRGDISVESTPGEGSKFTVRLPFNLNEQKIIMN